MTPTQTVENYYRALRAGDSLEPLPVERTDVVQFGASQRLAGSDAVAEPDDDAPRWQFAGTDVGAPRER